MVRGLIQQQRLRMPKQRLRQQHAHFLSALQFPHLAAVQFVGNIQTLQQDRGIALTRITVFFADNAFQLAELHAIGVCHVVLGVNRVALLQRRPQTLVSHDDRIDHAVGVERELVLAQDSQLPGTHDRALLRLQFAAEQLHERRFSGAVWSGQAITLARRERRGHFFKQYFGAVAHGHIAD